MEKQENPEMIDVIKKIAMDLSVSNPHSMLMCLITSIMT